MNVPTSQKMWNTTSGNRDEKGTGSRERCLSPSPSSPLTILHTQERKAHSGDCFVGLFIRRLRRIACMAHLFDPDQIVPPINIHAPAQPVARIMLL